MGAPYTTLNLSQQFTRFSGFPANIEIARSILILGVLSAIFRKNAYASLLPLFFLSGILLYSPALIFWLREPSRRCQL